MITAIVVLAIVGGILCAIAIFGFYIVDQINEDPPMIAHAWSTDDDPPEEVIEEQ